MYLVILLCSLWFEPLKHVCMLDLLSIFKTDLFAVIILLYYNEFNYASINVRHAIKYLKKMSNKKTDISFFQSSFPLERETIYTPPPESAHN